MTQRAIVRQHALAAWHDAGGDRLSARANRYRTARAVRVDLQVGFPLAALLTLFQIVYFLGWLYDRWSKHPPQDHDPDELAALEAVAIRD